MQRAPLATVILFTLLLPSCGVGFMRKPAPGEVALVTAPSGKALVNFHRPSGWLGGIDYEVFDRDKLIGNLKGKGRFQYSCDPGEHVFIGTAQRGSAIKADLAADKVYDVVINAYPGGFFQANIVMEPIAKAHKKRGELPNWERRERLWVFADDKRCRKFEKRRQKWATKTLEDFLNGSHKDKLQTLGSDDHR